MKVTSKLGRLALRYDYTIICDDITPTTKKLGNGRVKRIVELSNPWEYTQKEIFERYNPDTIVSRWVDTFTEDNQPAMAVVLKEEE